MFDDKLFAVLCVISIIILCLITVHLLLVVLSMMDLAFGFSFIDGQSVLRAVFK